MTAQVLALFTTALELTGRDRLMLMMPLCLSIAVIYKATRVEDLKQLPAAAAALWVTIVLGMGAVGVALWLLFRIFV